LKARKEIMANIIDWLAGRKHIKFKEGAGLSLAIQTIEEFACRTFSCPETTPKTFGIDKEEILELIQKELPSYYDYRAKIKKYIDRNGIPQAEIEIVGSIGMSRRYNPLDRTFHIATEAPKLHGS
jgi:hypothetical protein